MAAPTTTMNPYVNLNNHMYFFEATNKIKWQDAFIFCQKLNMLLVSIETEEESALITDYLNTSKLSVTNNYWTSGYENNPNTDIFTWKSTGELLNYFNWYLNDQPITAAQSIIYISQNLFWDDVDLQSNFDAYPLCEEPSIIAATTTKAPTFVDPFYVFNNITYYFEPNDQISWYDAIVFCREMDMLSVSIESAAENTFIINTLKNITYGKNVIFWTSGYSDSSSPAIFKWNSTGKNMSYTGWEPRYSPSKDTKPLNAVCLPTWANFSWDDTAPVYKMYPLCEDPMVPFTMAPKTNLFELGNNIYHFEKTYTMSWNAAIDFCKSISMSLVSIETVDENKLIKTHISTFGKNYWISGYEDSNKYIWNSTEQAINYFDWRFGQPNHDGSVLYLQYSKWSGIKWDDASPTSPNIYPMCEIKTANLSSVQKRRLLRNRHDRGYY